MIKFEDLAEEIKETKDQIGKTESKQRRYQLHRHLNKLLKEYRVGMRLYKEAQKTMTERKPNDERISHS